MATRLGALDSSNLCLRYIFIICLGLFFYYSFAWAVQLGCLFLTYLADCPPLRLIESACIFIPS